MIQSFSCVSSRRLDRASLADLGFDPTISRIQMGPPTGKPPLRITVHDTAVGRRQYDVIQVLYVVSADPMTGLGVESGSSRTPTNSVHPFDFSRTAGWTLAAHAMALTWRILPTAKVFEARRQFLTAQACGDVHIEDNDPKSYLAVQSTIAKIRNLMCGIPCRLRPWLTPKCLNRRCHPLMSQAGIKSAESDRPSIE